MINQNITKNLKNRELTKYTVREVLDSLYFEVVDHDSDFDGFIHLTSDLNGLGFKIKIADLKNLLPQDK